MDLTWLLLTLSFATIVVCMLIDFEIKDKKHLYWLGLFVVIMIIIDSYVWIKFGHETFMKRYTLLAQIPLYIAFLFVSKYKGIKLLFVHLTVVALVSSVVLIAVIIAGYFGLTKNQMDLISLIMYIPTGFITYKFFRPYILYMLRNNDKGWLGFCIIPLSYAIITYSYGHYNTGEIISNADFASIMRGLIFTIISYVTILWLFKQTREQLQMQNEQNLLQIQIEASKHNLEALKESQELTLLYRHDMRHHLNLIKAYLAHNNKEAAQNYIDEVEMIIESATVETYCNNYSLNLILNFYITKARELKIDIEKIQIELPTELFISDMDICLIFSNAIENAINALASVHDKANRKLSILCKLKSNKLHIEISNNFEGSVDFIDEIPISTSANHGLGTKSIASITEKYGGVYSFSAENGIFKTRIII